MHGFLGSLFGALLSWWGIWLLAALDSTIVFFAPLGIDLAVIVLVSHSPEKFWLYAILATAGSLCGAAITYYLGRRIGEIGLRRFVSARRLARVQRRIEKKGAIAIAVLDVLPPPFPFTAFILAAGAIRVNTYRFFIALGFFRLVRFGTEATLAFFYGPQIIGRLKSDIFEYVALFLLVVVIAGTVLTIANLVRNTRRGRHTARSKRAA